MAVNWADALQGLGAMAMAFDDPRQSILMSQGILRRNEQAKQRKAQEARQRQELELRQQQQQLRQAQFQAEQDALEQQAEQQAAGRQQLYARLGMPASPAMMPANLSADVGAIWTPGRVPPPAAQLGPGQEAQLMRAALDDPTGRTPMPFNPQPLGPGILPNISQAPLQTQGRYPEYVRQHAMMLSVSGDDVGASKVLSDYDQRQAELARKAAEPTAMERNVQAYMNMTPEQQAAQRAMRGPGTQITNVMGGQEPDPESGYVWARGPNMERVPETYTDPTTGESFQRYRQIPATRKQLSSEELRTVSLADTVVDQVGQVREALQNFSGSDRAAYAARGVPIIGDFFANTEGGRARILHDTSIMNTGFAVSGAEAPEREVARLQRNHGFTIHDNLETAMMKLDAQEALAQRVRAYRLGPNVDQKKAIPKEVMDGWQDEINAEFQQAGRPQMPYGFDPGKGYSFSSYDPRGVYVYTNESGERRYFPAKDVIK